VSRGQPHPEPRRLDDGRILVTRHVVAQLGHRHINYVRREIPPVACDVRTRAALLDLDQAEAILAGRQHLRPERLVPLRPE
jgi:hypothetical protein